jgi:putative tryptophan/tyrosine transport system substrate-binding protein
VRLTFRLGLQSRIDDAFRQSRLRSTSSSLCHLPQAFWALGDDPLSPKPARMLTGRWLSLLKELVPGIDRVMVLHDPGDAILLSGLQDAALALHVMIRPAFATAIADAEREIKTFAHDPGGGMIVVPSALTVQERATIVALAARHHLPAIYGGDAWVPIGGLASYAAETDEISRNVAHYADRILKGAKPADLPVQAPTKFRLAINARTAKALGLSIPPHVLAIADEVIE